MEQQTRALLDLLSADGTDAILSRLAKGKAGKTELAEELHLDPREVASTLRLLRLVGLVRYRKVKGKKGGRPREVWELAAAEELENLESYVRQMQHRLIDASDPRSANG